MSKIEKIDFTDYKTEFQNRFKGLRKHLLLANQKTFVQRIDSQIDDRKPWLNSIAQAVTGKTLESFNDTDEMLLYEKFKSMILELDSLTNLSKVDIDESKEEIIGVKIDTLKQQFDNIKANDYLTGNYLTITYDYPNGRNEVILVIECKSTIVTSVLSTKDKAELKKLLPSFIELSNTLKILGTTLKEE